MSARVEAEYEYVDEGGRTLFFVERLVPKDFRQYHLEDGRKVYNLQGVRRVLYRLPEVLAAVREGRWVILVEGEKDAESVAATIDPKTKKNRTATTCPMGAGKWLAEYTQVLYGARVGIIADADETGRRHALSVACELDPVVAELRVFEPKIHKDITAQLNAGVPFENLRPFDRAAAQATLIPKNARRRSGVVSAKDFCARPGLNGSLQLLGPALNRTMRLSIGALTGDGKTTFGLQMIRAVVRGEPFLKEEWRGKGGRALIVDVEQGEETVKQRLRDLDLHEDPNVDLLWEPDGLALDRDLEDRKYVESVLAKGRYDVALFDPLYQLHCGNENEERTAADVMRVLDGWARRFEIGIVIPMHRRKPHPMARINSFTINDIGGHGAWVRNSEIVLGLQFDFPGKSRLRFFKDRPGRLPGVGTWWTLRFDSNTHTFRYVEDEEQRGWKATKDMLRQEPGATAAEIAAAFGITATTVRGHLSKIGAYSDESDPPRWSLEPWPRRQQSFEMEEVPVGSVDAA